MPIVPNPEGLVYLKELRTRKQPFNPVDDIASDLTHCDSKEWDLFFFCSDGVVPAHRLVIANASKYILHMLDDQPPWHPTFVHTMDLPKNIVQILVDLAYTGEMKFAEELQSDVFDAMHTLGWVHTDCLSANFDGEEIEFATKSPPKIDLKSKSQRNVDSENLTASSPKKYAWTSPPRKALSDAGSKSPVARVSRPNERISFNEDESMQMEISQLPDVDWSDTEDCNVDNKETKESTNKNSPVNNKGKKAQESKNENKQPGKAQQKKSAAKGGRKSVRNSTRRPSFSEPNQQANDDDDKEIILEEETEPKTPIKKVARGNKKKVEKEDPVASAVPEIPMDEGSRMSTASESASTSDSPGKRQRRKPKKFEDFEEIVEKPKSRSPQKQVATATATNSKGKKKGNSKEQEEVEKIENAPSSSDKDRKEDGKNNTDEGKSGVEEVDLTNSQPDDNVPKKDDNESATNAKSSKPPAKTSNRKRLSGEAPANNSLITSYFTKQQSEKDDDKDSKSDDKKVTTNTTTATPRKGRGKGAQKAADSDKKDAAETVSLEEANDESPEVEENGGNGIGKRESKKRSFDEILASNIKPTEGKEVEEKTTVNLDGDADAANKKNENNEDKDKAPPIPARKSSRQASKALSTESDKSKADESEPPPRKRSRKETAEDGGIVAVLNESGESSSGPPSRRSSTK